MIHEEAHCVERVRHRVFARVCTALAVLSRCMTVDRIHPGLERSRPESTQAFPICLGSQHESGTAAGGDDVLTVLVLNLIFIL
jgi:hypothetical protein